MSSTTLLLEISLERKVCGGEGGGGRAEGRGGRRVARVGGPARPGAACAGARLLWAPLKPRSLWVQQILHAIVPDKHMCVYTWCAPAEWYRTWGADRFMPSLLPRWL